MSARCAWMGALCLCCFSLGAPHSAAHCVRVRHKQTTRSLHQRQRRSAADTPRRPPRRLPAAGSTRSARSRGPLPGVFRARGQRRVCGGLPAVHSVRLEPVGGEPVGGLCRGCRAVPRLQGCPTRPRRGCTDAPCLRRFLAPLPSGPLLTPSWRTPPPPAGGGVGRRRALPLRRLPARQHDRPAGGVGGGRLQGQASLGCRGGGSTAGGSAQRSASWLAPAPSLVGTRTHTRLQGWHSHLPPPLPPAACARPARQGQALRLQRHAHLGPLGQPAVCCPSEKTAAGCRLMQRRRATEGAQLRATRRQPHTRPAPHPRRPRLGGTTSRRCGGWTTCWTRRGGPAFASSWPSPGGCCAALRCAALRQGGSGAGAPRLARALSPPARTLPVYHNHRPAATGPPPAVCLSTSSGQAAPSRHGGEGAVGRVPAGLPQAHPRCIPAHPGLAPLPCCRLTSSPSPKSRTCTRALWRRWWAAAGWPLDEVAGCWAGLGWRAVAPTAAASAQQRSPRAACRPCLPRHARRPRASTPSTAAPTRTTPPSWPGWVQRARVHSDAGGLAA